MARIRTIKPEFWSSEQIVECSAIARLLFVGMWTFADDRGVIPRRPRTIKMQVFPGDDFSIQQIEEWLNELEGHKLIGRFEHGGDEFYAITGWRHQKIERPTYKYPEPPAQLRFGDYSPRTRRHVNDTSPPDGNGMEGNGRECNTADIVEHSTSTRRFVRPTIEEVGEYCRERGSKVDPSKFFAYYESNGWRVGRNPMKDWRAAVRTWESNIASGGGAGQPRLFPETDPRGTFATCQSYLDKMNSQAEVVNA
jgi:hypothetical protein